MKHRSNTAMTDHTAATADATATRPADHDDGAAAYPQLQLLAETTAPLVTPAIRARQSCLNDPHLRQILTDHLQMRNAIRRELDACRRNHEVVPPGLERVLREFLSASTAMPLPSSDLGDDSPTRPRAPADVSDLSVPGGSTIHHATPHHSRVDTSATAFEKDVIRNLERPTTKLVLGAEYKKSVEAAHAARTAGRRREEVIALNDLMARLKAAPVPDTHAACRVLRQLGDAHLALQEFGSAEAHFFDWVLVAEKQGDGREVARAMTAVGKAREAAGDLTRALEWYEKAALRMRTVEPKPY